MDLHGEAGKENEQMLANLSPVEEAMSKDEVEIIDVFVPLLSCLAIIIINILLTKVGRSVWENLDLRHCWYRPHCVRSVLATSVKILS